MSTMKHDTAKNMKLQGKELHCCTRIGLVWFVKSTKTHPYKGPKVFRGILTLFKIKLGFKNF